MIMLKTYTYYWKDSFYNSENNESIENDMVIYDDDNKVEINIIH